MASIEEIDARLKAVESAVVTLQQHDAQVDGFLVKIDNLILKNPKVILLAGMVLSSLVTHFAPKALMPVDPAPQPINIHLPVESKKDEPAKKVELPKAKGGWQ